MVLGVVPTFLLTLNPKLYGVGRCTNFYFDVKQKKQKRETNALSPRRGNCQGCVCTVQYLDQHLLTMTNQNWLLTHCYSICHSVKVLRMARERVIQDLKLSNREFRTIKVLELVLLIEHAR